MPLSDGYSFFLAFASESAYFHQNMLRLYFLQRSVFIGETPEFVLYMRHLMKSIEILCSFFSGLLSYIISLNEYAIVFLVFVQIYSWSYYFCPFFCS